MARRFSRAVLFAVPAVLLFGCSSGEPEVIAEGSLQTTQSSDGRFDEIILVQGCREGRYLGEFEGAYDSALDPNRPALTGMIRFSLERAASGEFLELTTSEIDGLLDSNLRFTADIVQSEPGCREGEFTSRLENGQVLSGGTPLSITFEGPVLGEYIAEESRFEGTWETSLVPSGGILGHGRWDATWIGENP